MKLIGVMSLTQHRDRVRKVFEQHEVKIYSEVEIIGHTADTIKKHGWWVFEKDGILMYSTLFFAVIPEEQAAEIMENIDSLKEDWDPNHPPRAFQVEVEKMV